MSEWIKLSERMPDSEPDHTIHKVYITFGEFGIGALQYNNIYKDVWTFQAITHWMLPPKTPIEIEKERESFENRLVSQKMELYFKSFYGRYNIPLQLTDA